MESLLLLSSDGRRRYAEDVQTVLAAPHGAVVQFRYPLRWVAPPLRRAVLSRKANSLPAVLGFHSTVTDSEPFVLPIRHATVAMADYIADWFVFQLRVGGYVDLRQYQLSLPGIVARSRELISRLPVTPEGALYSATSDPAQLPEEVGADAADRWITAARRLALHPSFENSYFLRVAAVETQRGKDVRFDATGRLQTVDGLSLRIVTNIYGKEYAPDAEFKLTCATDGTNVRVASEDVYHVAVKYDLVEFWLHLAAQSYNIYSRVTISLASDKAETLAIPAHVRLPLVVTRSKSRVFRRWAVACAGAVLVALPSILGPESPLQVRIGVALAGAGLLALSGAVLSSPK
ncbi:hypothetical protein OG558_30820 [Kribbella sp. NBC_01510]|uniref:hypothetical protein n=1 Tax=Kribbella sp. NBC_01510 TaxID=2903581 RepID=UPI00386CD69E